MAIENTDRVRMRETRPYFTPDSLDDLQGPATGLVELDLTVLWVKDKTFDVGTFAGARAAYQAVVAEGVTEDQTRVLNKQRLIEIWPELFLDRRVVKIWEDKFPELIQAS